MFQRRRNGKYHHEEQIGTQNNFNYILAIDNQGRINQKTKRREYGSAAYTEKSRSSTRKNARQDEFDY